MAAGSENFRGANVRFLQELHRDALNSLKRVEEERDEAFQAVQQWETKKDQVEREVERLQQGLVSSEERVDIARAEIHRRDEEIRVLSEQNKNILEMLEKEEEEHRQKVTAWENLKAELKRLQGISDEYDRVKAAGDQQLAQVRSEAARAKEELRNSHTETEQLRTAAANYAQQAKVDVEALENQLADAKKKNVDYVTQIQHNEIAEHRMAETIQKLKETLEDLTLQKKSFRMQLDGDTEVRDAWTKSKMEIEMRKEKLSSTVEALKASLHAAEDSNTQLQRDQSEGADNYRVLGDKVYSLMEQLRQNNVDLKKHESDGVDKEKKIALLDKQASMLQARSSAEVEARLAAEADARSATQMQALLQKKNKKLEESITLALKAQEKVEKRQQELTDKANQLQAQNEYLATRIDGQEEDKGALRQELRKMEDDLRQATGTHTELSGQHTELEDRLNEIDAEKTALMAELDYIKREDMLDATGRTKPILIESNDSKLVERLQINEFLYSAQQARNPVPMLIEKLSHLLELLHTAQRQADLYLQDLQRSNSLLTALRGKNKVLYERTQNCELWKMKALLRIASNEFELRSTVPGHISRGGGHSLYLDGLQYTLKELEELQKVITSFNKQDSVIQIRLKENQLDASSVPALMELIDMCPYLNRLELTRNRLDQDSIMQIQNHIDRIPGVTNVQVDPATGDLIAKSGHQVRLTVTLDEQNPTDGPGAGDSGVSPDLSVGAADDFLQTAAGLTTQTRLMGPEANVSAGSGMAATRRLSGAAGSESTLPRITPSSTAQDPLGSTARPGSASMRAHAQRG